MFLIIDQCIISYPLRQLSILLFKNVYSQVFIIIMKLKNVYMYALLLKINKKYIKSVVSVITFLPVHLHIKYLIPELPLYICIFI